MAGNGEERGLEIYVESPILMPAETASRAGLEISAPVSVTGEPGRWRFAAALKGIIPAGRERKVKVGTEG